MAERLELVVVVPVYNEENALRAVVYEWFCELRKWTMDFIVLAIDDGSTDRSLHVLHQLRAELGCQLVVVTRPNVGHGQTCLEGYSAAVEMNAEYVLQIDSDGQCDPCWFSAFWEHRGEYDAVFGHRTRREDGAFRQIVSRVLRLFLLLAVHVSCPDANVPYRLMKISKIRTAIEAVPRSFSLANVALALLIRESGCSTMDIRISFRTRYVPRPNYTIVELCRKAMTLHSDIRRLKQRRGLGRKGPASPRQCICSVTDTRNKGGA